MKVAEFKGEFPLKNADKIRERERVQYTLVAILCYLQFDMLAGILASKFSNHVHGIERSAHAIELEARAAFETKKNRV